MRCLRRCFHQAKTELLLWAAKNDRTGWAQAALWLGADVKAQSGAPLTQAVQAGHITMAHLLINAGAAVTEDFLVSPLTQPCFQKPDPDIADLLLGRYLRTHPTDATAAQVLDTLYTARCRQIAKDHGDSPRRLPRRSHADAYRTFAELHFAEGYRDPIIDILRHHIRTAAETYGPPSDCDRLWRRTAPSALNLQAG
jgi:hypothetical protein